MRAHPILLSLAVTLMITGGACSRKPDVKSTVSELEKAFQAPAGVPAAAASAPAGAAEAHELVQTALAAARTDDFANGVLALQAARRQPGVSAEQLMVVQRTMQALTTDLANRAASGDEKALAQLKAIERTRSQ